MTNFEGVLLSDYLLMEGISRGGVADVYRARRAGEGMYEVAVKVFRPGYAQRQSFREYFMAEAEKIGQFDHPNILPYLEYGEGEGLLYAVTPFVASGTLDDLLKRVGGKFTAIQALPIMQQLCSAVQYAHEHDVIHGNIKPSNVFITSEGRILLADFGIARGYDDSQQSLTRVGWGSAEYAAPEQSLGIVKPASDMYTLGVLLFRLLTGYLPFTGQTPVEVLLKHVRQPPPSARSLEPSISDAVDGVLHMALQKRADDRFATAEEFSNALLAAVTMAPVASPVAKSVAFATRQFHLEVPLTPMPAAINDPQTPLPPHTSFTPPPGYGEQFNWTQAAQPASAPLPSATIVESGSEYAGSDITQVREKSFLEEDDDAGTYMFWSSNPVEWSPIGDGRAGPVPPTAVEYLHSKPMMPEAPADTSQSVEEGGKEEAQRVPRSWRKNLLPILVVILLLIGLLGALLSSFFFPAASGHAGMVVVICVNVEPFLARRVGFWREY